MYPVSPEYLEAMNKTTRDSSFFEIGFDVVNQEIENNAEIIEFSEIIPWSNPYKIIRKIEESIQFGTFEEKYLRADGMQHIYDFDHTTPTVLDNKGGFESKWLSDANNSFSNNGIYPYVVIDLKSPQDLFALTLYFDIFGNDYVDTFEVWGYLVGETNLQKRLIENNKDVVAIIKDLDFTNVRYLKIVLMKSNRPNIRARLWEVKFGIAFRYTNENFQKVTVNNLTDPTSSTLPNQNITFSIWDFDKEFNPENPTGIYEYLSGGQKIIAKFGVQTVSGIEWQPIGIYYLNDWSTGINTAEFKAVSKIDLMNEIFIPYEYIEKLKAQPGYLVSGRDTFYRAGYSLISLIKEIFKNETDYILEIDSNVIDLTTIAVPPRTLQKREILQLALQALGCGIKIERNTIDNKGIVKVYKLEQGKINYVMDFNNSNKPELYKTPELKQIDVKVYSYVAEDIKSEFWRTRISTTGQLSAITKLPLATFVGFGFIWSDAIIQGGYNFTVNHLTEETTLVGHTDINPGYFDLAITGNKINIFNTLYTKSVSENGETLSIDNMFCTSQAIAQRIANTYEYWFKPRLNYNVTMNRGEPAIDITNTIGLQTIFSEQIETTLMSHSYDWEQGAVRNAKANLKVGGVL